MAHSSSDTNMSIPERDFHECMQHGNDFFKIELLRQAKKCYTKALDFNMEIDTVKHRIAECNNMLKFEKKVTGILTVVASVIVVLSFIIWY